VVPFLKFVFAEVLSEQAAGAVLQGKEIIERDFGERSGSGVSGCGGFEGIEPVEWGLASGHGRDFAFAGNSV
jgi:hypothetical protein